jgi:hypothetical protein
MAVNENYVRDTVNFTPTPPDLTSQNIGISEPGQFVLSTAKLYLSNLQPFELKPSMIELCIKEDLFSFASSGYILITDSSGFIEKYNISGFNYIELIFSKTGNSDPNSIKHSRVYRVFSIGKRFQTSRTNEQYAIEFCSEELLLSEQIKIAKGYKERYISNMILDIMYEYLETNEKKINIVEETKGKYSFVVPNLRMFEAISWLSTYAQPANSDHIGADMIFFENREGYNFRSLQSMMSDRVYNSYHYSPQNLSQTSLNYDSNAMLSYKFTKMFDTLEAIKSGAFANKIIAIDPLIRHVDVKTFDYEKYFEQSKHLNSDKVTTGYVNRFGKKVNEMYDSVVKVATTNADQRTFDSIKNYSPRSVAPSIGLEVYIPNRTAQLSLINYTKIEFVVPGDPGLAVGNVINLGIPSYSTPQTTTKANLDEYHSGRYLVSAISHIMVGPNGSYYCNVEAIKDSVSKTNDNFVSNTVGSKEITEA